MITLETIAKKCGVSKMTVSRALGTKGEQVSDEKREQIMKVAKEFNYRQNRLANSFNTGRTHLIAYLASEFRHFQSVVFSGVQAAAISNDYDILTLQWSETLKTGDKLLKSIVDRRVEGIMLFHGDPGCDYSYLEDFRRHNIPVIVLDRDINVPGFGYVGLENYKGSLEITNHLINSGHKSIVFLCRQEDWGYSTTTDRYEGYKEALKASGLKPEDPVIVPTDICQVNDYISFVKDIHHEKTTAIVADNDVVAFYCILGLCERGYKIPEDFSVVGFGNIKGYVELIRPGLTTMDLDPKRIGLAATKLLFDMIAEKYGEGDRIHNNRIILPMKLVARESTAKI
jgi:DNA-binding LacI/PurR family transcriptional regulator